MGISVEGQKCPVCGAYIFDNDDLVFCPECGAPHHRDCYEALGHCAYKDKHGTDEGYDPDKFKENVASPEREQPDSKAEKNCRFCGERLEENEKVCHNCGRPQINARNTPFGPGIAITMDPLGGVAPDEMIEDIPAKEVKDFVAINTQRYLPRFKAMNNKKKGSWNWAAFLVPHVWFFYRKMYFQGVLFTLLTLASSLFLLPLSAVVSTFPREATSSTVMLAKYMAENVAAINGLPIYLALAGGIAEIVIRIIAGFKGDRIYRKAAIADVKRVKAKENESEEPLNLQLAKKGGVNIFAGLIGLFALDFILEWIGALYIVL
ncbi:MAG: DUF2628 domain-containing protein [Clostridia bacterium]|nr:DUF2628 domain-containing protein [Clostridia bacterium]